MMRSKSSIASPSKILFEASSFFVDEGNRPRIGQAFLVVDPGALAGEAAYGDRVEVLVAEMLKDDGVRLPGACWLVRANAR